MKNHHPANERIKRQYFAFLKEAKRHSEPSVDIKRVIPTGELVPAKIVGEFHTGRGDETRESPQAHIIAEDGTESVVNAHYLDAILTKYPNAKVFLKAGENNLNKVLFKDKGKMVALLMPIVEGEVRVRETFADRIAEITRKKEHEAAAAKEPEDKEVHGGADFVAAPDGSINFGEITPDISKSISRSAAPIRLTNERLKYIESNHREQIMSAGYDSVQSFIGDVVSGYSEIREGKGNTLLIAKGEEKKRIVFIELKPDESGNYYTINNAYPARPGYVESKNLLWSSAQSSSARKPEPSLKRQEESSNKRIVQEEKKVKEKEPAEGIQDFGEKLGGARKYDVMEIENTPKAPAGPSPTFKTSSKDRKSCRLRERANPSVNSDLITGASDHERAQPSQ